METPSIASPDGGIREPELELRRRELAETRRELEALVSRSSPRQIAWRPSPDRWSVAHCVEHLARTAEQYLPALRRSIRGARARGATGRGPFRYGPLSRWLVRALEPPPRRRLSAPRRFRPTAAPDVGEAMRAYLEGHAALEGCIREADGLHLARATLRSPAFPLLRLPLGQAFAVLAAHERRHLWQARELTRHPEFPDAQGDASAAPAARGRR